MSIAEFADKIVNNIGLGERLVQPPKPRHLRWMPGFILSIAIFATILHFFSESLQGRIVAWSLMMSAWAVADLVALFGPLRQLSFDDQYDERERLTAIRARLFGFYAVFALTVAGLLFFAGSAAMHWPLPSTLADWLMMLGLLLTVRATLTTLHASWTTSPVDDDDMLD